MPKRSPALDEFALIARLFAPLAARFPGAQGLADDVAYLGGVEDGKGLVAADEELVIKTDAIVATVHFLPDDPPDLVARKLLRVNLSDLAGKGARPLVYTLAAILPRGLETSWLEGFAAGLKLDQELYGVTLVGGDLDATPGPLSFSLTILGAIPAGQRLLRMSARPGDAVFVSGTLGDAALGLRVLRGELAALNSEERGYLVDRYQLPRPRLTLGARLRGIVHASMDISDGLLGDLVHICETSGVGAVIEAGRLPLSPAARGAIAGEPRLIEDVLGAGDDYELLFTAPPESERTLTAIGRELDVPVTRIGCLDATKSLHVLDRAGREMQIAHRGYRHF